MKKLIMAAVAAAMAVVIGCKSMPSPDMVRGLSFAIGAGTAYGCEIGKLDADSKIAVTNIMTIVRDAVPETNSTYVATWTPLVAREIQKYVDAGKIDQNQANMITTVVLLGAQGVDYMFVRHPDWKQYNDIAVVAIDGFVDGFLAVFKQYNVCCGSKEPVAYDEEAYLFTKSQLQLLKALKK